MEGGVNFALYSQHAREVFLLLFGADDGQPTDVIRVAECTRHIWHCRVQGLGAGQRYGYKMMGDFDPAHGLRFNQAKLLLDPYAKAVTGKFRNEANLLLAYDPASPLADLSRDLRDDSAVVPKALVVDDRFDWQGDEPLEIPLEQLVVYEVHAKGFTAHASSGVRHPGTYLGFIDRITYLKELGINAVELLPVQEFHVEDALSERDLTNYWGYNTIAFFAPESFYSTRREPGCAVTEFKTLVRELHKAGIEVILDVVFNHTAEGNERGPTMSFRGIDNPTWYALTGSQWEPARYYLNHTGCGNTVNFDHPAVIRFVMDCLRYWAQEMHVDGFRFDLASVLGREDGFYRKSASFFDAIAQDPVLCRVKLIAEPWDLGTYEVGNFPVDWSEWNGRFRDTARRFVRGDTGQIRDLASRLTGSADLYADDGRSPYNSINFVTCHDGFTLADLVAYNGKHNEANGEGNRDGTDDNASWNCGAEGPSDDPAVLALRRRQAKNLACLLLFANGTPMLLGGDEFLRSQGGNNNAYCQDNAVNWFDWRLVDQNADMLAFVRKAIAFLRRHPVLQRRKFLLGLDRDGNRVPDVAWYGTDLNPPRWDDPEARTLCYRLDGAESGGDYQLFFILNADWRMQAVVLPEVEGKRWRRVVDTSLAAGEDFTELGEEVPIDPPGHYLANGRSTVVLVAKPAP
ncbi:MAG: glycogen debranching protein GlgX [Betaproteobacteria bacterium]|nr:glycogen debranching protein GlgX [Betaproteobacteria bacterium]